MISSTIWFALAAIDIGLVIYSFWDHDNRIYGNIITAGLTSILSAVLALFVMAGEVVDQTPQVISTLANTTLNTTTTYTYARSQVIMQNATLSYFLGFVSVFMMVVVIMMIIDARSEAAEENID